MSVTDSPVTATLRKVAVIGNPNTGKSTLFNALTGMQSRTGNFPGVTVEKKIGRLHLDNRVVDLIDLPGTYSLSPRTPDEMVSVDVLLGRQKDVGEVDAIVCIVDASNLERNLYLVSQVLDLGLPAILVLNMWDVAQARQVSIDVEGLRQRLGMQVIVCEAHRRMGVHELRQAIIHSDTLVAPIRPMPFPEEFYAECGLLKKTLTALGSRKLPFYLIERLLIDVDGHVEIQLAAEHGEGLTSVLKDARARLRESGCRVPIVEAKARYRWAREILDGVASVPRTRVTTRSDRIDRVLTHRFIGLLFFAAVMFLVFQAIYTWSGPLMDVIESGQNIVADLVQASVPVGPLRSLLIDGAIAGVGGVLIFVPQIALLFFFIAILEDCGYMARAAFVMDRLMTKLGLSGKSFVPLMSSFACAIPGVMATRVIENRRDRMVTILVAPLMSCSARLPVYLLMTTAFVPPVMYAGGWVSLREIVLFVMYLVGIFVAIPVAWLLRKTFFKGETPPFVMELPSYKWPSIRIVMARVLDCSKAFVVRAGTLIFATTVLVWAAGYFPADHTAQHQLAAQIELSEIQIAQFYADGNQSAAKQATVELTELLEKQNQISGDLIEASFLGRTGHAIEPFVKPLGWDWKIGVGVIASFPAREVIIATLGTIYSLGGDVAEDDASLTDKLRAAKHPDGTPVFNVAVACSIMVFFALCAQCAATLMVIRRETNSWRWPIFTFAYMTTLAYVGALVTYQVGMLLLT
ncbi:MAG: ferrous iron transport protein B [Planctomycetota bacterium]|nr:ferrous iron transport protein B [Planctomycetota bacterium]